MMKEIRPKFSKVIFLCCLSIYLSACSFGSRMVHVTNKDKFENPYISFNAPTKNWRIYNRKWRIGTNNNRFYKTIFNDSLSNGSLEIEVTSKPTNSIVYFNKDFDYHEMWERMNKDPREIERNREQNITYDEAEVTYYRGMKCTNSVFSRGYGGDMYSASSKNYLLSCGYYHKTEGKRLIVVSYRYYGASGVSRLQEEAGKKATDIPPLSEAERVLKKDLKEVLDSIVLKDVDWDRMDREGLLYDKPYKTIRW